jgi:hypothetical protein
MAFDLVKHKDDQVELSTIDPNYLSIDDEDSLKR